MFKLTGIKGAIPTVVAIAAIVCSATVLLISSVIGKDPAAEAGKSEADKVMALDKMWSDKYNTGDIQWISNILAANSMQFPPNAPIIKGKEAVTAAWQGMMNTKGLEVSWTPTDAIVAASKDLAYTWGTAKMKSPDGSSADVKYVAVWVREGGEWKVAADIFNEDGAPTK